MLDLVVVPGKSVGDFYLGSFFKKFFLSLSLGLEEEKWMLTKCKTTRNAHFGSRSEDTGRAVDNAGGAEVSRNRSSLVLHHH